MKKRKAKRINPKDGIDTKIKEFRIETENEKRTRFLNLIAKIIVKVTLKEYYSNNGFFD